MQAFLKNLCLRPSCYDCAFKTKNRQADITLADFWGVQNVRPEMDDDKGTSLVILHSAKGKDVFNEISERLKYIEVNADEAIKHNSAMIKSVFKPKNRERFMINIQRKPFDKTVKKYCNIRFINKVKNKLLFYIKKLRRQI